MKNVSNVGESIVGESNNVPVSDEVNNFFNISIKNKVQYKFLVSFYLFVFHESIGESELVNLSTSYS